MQNVQQVWQCVNLTAQSDCTFPDFLSACVFTILSILIGKHALKGFPLSFTLPRAGLAEARPPPFTTTYLRHEHPECDDRRERMDALIGP